MIINGDIRMGRNIGLITGAASGIGLKTVKRLLKKVGKSTVSTMIKMVWNSLQRDR